MERTPLVFAVLSLSWLSQTSVIAQVENEKQAIDVLIKVSKQIEANQQANPQKLIDDAWKPIPSALKAKSSVLYAYSLARLANNLESYTYFNRLSILSPDDYRVKKAHIYSAFKDKGGVTACTLINKYVRPNLNNVDPAPELKEFLLWASVVIESISVEEPIQKKLKFLIDSEQYDAFKQANARDLQPLLEAAGINLKKLNFNAANNLDKQIIQGKELLKAKVGLYENNRKAALELHFQLLFAAKSSIPTLQLKVSANGLGYHDQLVQPDPFFGFRRLESKDSKIGALGDSVNAASFMDDSFGYHPIIFRDLRSGQIRISLDHLWLRGFYAQISAAGPILARYNENRQRLLLLDRNFSIFLVNFEKTYREGIENDAELRQAINFWRVKLAEFNAQLSYSNKLNSKLQSIENKTLKLLGNKVLKFIAFSPKEALEKLEAN